MLGREENISKVMQNDRIGTKTKEMMIGAINFFEHKKLQYIFMHEMNVLMSGMKMGNGEFGLLIDFDPEVCSMSITALLQLRCPKEYRLLMERMLVEINCHFRYGSFRMDEDGEIIFHYGYSYRTREHFDAEEFEFYFNCCIATADRFYQELQEVTEGRKILTAAEKTAWMEEIMGFSRNITRCIV